MDRKPLDSPIHFKTMTTSTIQSPFSTRFITRQEALKALRHAYNSDAQLVSYDKLTGDEWTQETVDEYNSILDSWAEELYDQWKVIADSPLANLIDNFVDSCEVVPFLDYIPD